MNEKDQLIHQFPVLTRPLQVPPSAAMNGKRINARIKVKAQRLEVHVPVDTRPEVWDKEKGKVFGAARVEDDRENNQDMVAGKGKGKEGDEPPLCEVRMQSERVPQNAAYVLGIVRDGRLCLHPIGEIHQLRPTLTYLDILSRKNKRHRTGGGGSDSESDGGPPPDPDEPAPNPVPRKEKTLGREAREAQVSARKSNEKGELQPLQGGLSTIRREMLSIIHDEQDESWTSLDYCDEQTGESGVALDTVFSQNEASLMSQTQVSALLNYTQMM